MKRIWFKYRTGKYPCDYKYKQKTLQVVDLPTTRDGWYVDYDAIYRLIRDWLKENTEYGMIVRVRAELPGIEW